MSKKTAEFLTGYEIRPIPGQAGRVRFAAFEQGELVGAAEGDDEVVVLRRLVRLVYGLHCREVLVEHRWRCARCWRARPLEIHHKRPRSLGGTHRRENLEPVCWDCHRGIHAHRVALEQDLRRPPRDGQSGGEDGL